RPAKSLQFIRRVREMHLGSRQAAGCVSRTLPGGAAMRQAVVVEAVRTPIARAHAEKGFYREVRADDLSADLMRALLDRVPFPANQIEDIQWGCVKQEKEQGYNIARMAALIAGFPVEVPATTVNRLCGASLQALNQSAQSIMAGVDDVQIAGGGEHMQHLP